MDDQESSDTFLVPANPALTAPYPQSLALEIVLKTAPIETILAAYNLTPAQFIEISRNEAFRKEVADLRAQAEEEGFSYRMRARAQAEGMLKTSWDMVHDPKTPASVRADLIKFTTRVAGYDNKDVAEGAQKERISITINLGGDDKRVIENVDS